MNNDDMYSATARKVSRLLGRKWHTTFVWSEFTAIGRQVSGDAARRIDPKGFQAALAKEGLRVYPPLDGRDQNRNFRIYRKDSVVDRIIDVILDPSRESDLELANIGMKVSGRWIWNTRNQPPEVA